MTLCDTSPLVSLINRKDKDHARCLAVLPSLSRPLVTTWACIAEAMHLLGKFQGHASQDALWQYITDGLIEIHVHDEAERAQMRDLMRKYRDTPMDLADASLVAAAGALQTRRVFTLDSDFYVYRLSDEGFDVVP